MVRAKADNRSSQFGSKEYKDGIDDLAKKTVVRVTDIDEKAVKFLDYLQQNGGRGKEACHYLKQALEGLTRDHVLNWKAYVYTLLRTFDPEAHKAMKESEGKKPRPPRVPRVDGKEKDKKDKFPVKPFTFNPGAAEFVPGAVQLAAPDAYQVYPAMWGVPAVQPPPAVQAAAPDDGTKDSPAPPAADAAVEDGGGAAAEAGETTKPEPEAATAGGVDEGGKGEQPAAEETEKKADQ